METNCSIIPPLQIDALPVPGTGGLLGMTICPGKKRRKGQVPTINSPIQMLIPDPSWFVIISG
jgi:hypothetical protein